MKWSKEDIELLKKLYPDKTIDKKEIIKQLNRSWDAIRWYARMIGLKLRTDVNYWSPEDEERLIELSKNLSLSSKDIAKHLNRNSGQIRAKIYALCIKRPKKEKKDGFTLVDIEEHMYD